MGRIAGRLSDIKSFIVMDVLERAKEMERQEIGRAHV